MKREIKFKLNGEEVTAEVESHWTLLYFLREVLKLKGTKEGCGYGECGACTVVIDKMAVNSCLFPVMEVNGKDVLTIEGISGPGEALHPLQKAFIEEGAVQCGFCTPGMIMSAYALFEEKKNPDDEDIKEAIEGNLCRCTGYVKIIDAINAAKRGK
ncbi:MAG: (2Fe-2S)-binding protein [Deltaproteobacteria bacterium]|nr:(2Fe-2S)-binding protein [Deltaproteobacteria bacterium]